jgi:hypothetical protein
MAKAKRIFGRGARTPGGVGGIVMDDDTVSFMRIAAVNYPKETTRVIRHLGFIFQDRFKDYMRRGGHGNPLSELQSERDLDRAASKGQRLRRKKFAGDINRGGKSLVNAIRYEPPKDGDKTAVVGWASNDARKVSGKRFQEGSRVTVTRKMQQMFFAAAENARGKAKRRLLGMASLPLGYVIVNPGRPIFDPVFNRIKPMLPRIVEARLQRNLGRMEEQAYRALLLSATGINENEREAKREARRFARKQRRSA